MSHRHTNHACGCAVVPTRRTRAPFSVCVTTHTTFITRGSRRAADAPGDLLAFIPSKSPGNSQPTAYEYQGTTAATSQTYWYSLKDVDASDVKTMHGPVSATLLDPLDVRVRDLRASPAAAVPIAFASLALFAGAIPAAQAVRRRALR